MPEKTLIQQYVQIAVVVTAYWFISITLGRYTYLLMTVFKKTIIFPRFLNIPLNGLDHEKNKIKVILILNLIFNHLINSSLVSVFVNKSLLSGSARLDAPLFVTWYQCIVTVLACYIIRQLARYFPDKVSFPELELDEKILKQVKLTIT